MSLCFFYDKKSSSMCHTYGCKKLNHKYISRYLNLPKFLVDIEESNQLSFRSIGVLYHFTNVFRVEKPSLSYLNDMVYKFFYNDSISCRKVFIIILLELSDMYKERSIIFDSYSSLNYIYNLMLRSSDLLFIEYLTSNYEKDKYFYSKKRNRRKLRILLKSIVFKKILYDLFIKVLDIRYRPFGAGYYEALESFNSVKF